MEGEVDEVVAVVGVIDNYSYYVFSSTKFQKLAFSSEIWPLKRDQIKFI